MTIGCRSVRHTLPLELDVDPPAREGERVARDGDVAARGFGAATPESRVVEDRASESRRDD
jgi:hypothetical protein